MFIGLGKTLPQIADLPGPSRPGHSAGGTKFMEWEIDLSLHDSTNLYQGFALGYQPAPGVSGSWYNGTIDVDWGDGTTETVNYQDAYSRRGGTNLAYRHQYPSASTYTIKLDFTNAFPTNETEGFRVLIMGASSTWTLTPDTSAAKRVTKFNSFGNTCRFINFRSFFSYCTNLVPDPIDTAEIMTGYEDIAWILQTIRDCQKMTKWKSKWFTMEKLPATFGTYSRYWNCWENTYLLEEFEFKNVNLGNCALGYFDAPSDYVGRDVPNGCKVTLDNVTVDNVQHRSIFYTGGFGRSTNRLHKDSVFRNITINNFSNSPAQLDITAMHGCGMIAAPDEHVVIDHTQWKKADNTPIDVGRTAFNWVPIIKDTAGNTNQNTWEIDLTSDSQWVLTGSYYAGAFYDFRVKAKPNSTVKIIGTANWDITGVTNWGYFQWYAPTGLKWDMDISGWEVWNTVTMNAFMLQSGLTTERYDQALIAWNNNVPASASAQNIRLGTSQYTSGGDAEAARTNLINTHGWTITDGGAV